MNTVINIAAYEPVSEVNGPGRRAVVWVQGCPKRCPGCWNPEFLEFRSDQEIAVADLAGRILTDRTDYALEGITLSGGEPFSQAGVLADLASTLQKSGMSVFSFSGYTLDEIRALGSDATRLLAQLDILVDGEFLRELRSPLRWRSSTNQVVHFLTDRYRQNDFDLDMPPEEFEIHLDPYSTRITGFPASTILKQLGK